MSSDKPYILNAYRNYNELFNFVNEQKENSSSKNQVSDEAMKELELSFISYVVSQMQTSFNDYINNQKFQNVVYKKDEGGIRSIYLKPFSLKIESSIKDILSQYENSIDINDIKEWVEKYNEITPEKKKDSKDRFIGFWLDLVSVAPKWYQGEKFYVDVYVDEADNGSIQFGIDDAPEIYQISLQED